MRYMEIEFLGRSYRSAFLLFIYIWSSVHSLHHIHLSYFSFSVVGGLLSSHLLSYRGGIELEPGWPCRGPLLKLAKEAAEKLLPGNLISVYICQLQVFVHSSMFSNR